MENIEKIVNYSEKLAHLRIPESIRPEFSEQIGKILNFVEKLNELDTSTVEPTAHILPVENVTRKDEIQPSMDRETFLAQAPVHNEESVKVPAVIQ